MLAAPSSTTYDLTESVSNSTDAAVYPEPSFPAVTFIAVTCPFDTVATASAPEPSPPINTLGTAT